RLAQDVLIHALAGGGAEQAVADEGLGAMVLALQEKEQGSAWEKNSEEETIDVFRDLETSDTHDSPRQNSPAEEREQKTNRDLKGLEEHLSEKMQASDQGRKRVKTARLVETEQQAAPVKKVTWAEETKEASSDETASPVEERKPE